MFFPPRYIIRAIKATLYIVCIMFIILAIIFLTSEKTRPDLTFIEFIPNPKQLIAFCVVFGIVYPLVSFIKKRALLMKSFSEERINIVKIFNTVGYELEKEENGILTFRIKNKLTRFMRLFYEDMIEVEYDDGGVTISGHRRDVYRIARHIEFLNNRNDDV